MDFRIKVKKCSLLNQVHLLYFILGVTSIIITGFCSAVGEADGKSVSVIEVLINHYEEIRLQTTWLDAFYSALYGWLILLLPVFTAISVVPLFCDEMKSQNYKLHMIRIGFSKYINQHFISAFLFGFFLVVIALGIYVLIMGQIFPSEHDFGDMVIIGYEEADVGEMVQLVLVNLLHFGILGGMLAIFSSIFVAFTQNIYIILALPFLINYIFRNWLLMENNRILITLTILFYLLGYLVWYIKYRRLVL